MRNDYMMYNVDQSYERTVSTIEDPHLKRNRKELAHPQCGRNMQKYEIHFSFL